MSDDKKVTVAFFYPNLLRGPCDECGEWVSYNSGFEDETAIVRVCEDCLKKCYPNAEVTERPKPEPEDISLEEACKRYADNFFAESPLLKAIRARENNG